MPRPGRAGCALGLLVLLLLSALVQPAHGQAAPARPDAPAVCRIGLNVEDLYDLDMARDTFGAILWVWSTCPSAELSPLGTIAFPTASASPDLGPVDIVNLAAGGQYASRRVQGTFRHDWVTADYPFDRQRVVIAIDETHYAAARLAFEADERGSFLSPDLRARLDEWQISELELQASVSDEPSSYGLPDAEGARYARLEAAIVMQRTDLVMFLKLTSGVFAGAFFAFLTLFYDPNDRSTFAGKLGLLVGVLFAVLLSLRNADAVIGDTGDLTLVTRIHLITLALVVAVALLALRARRRVDGGLPVRHPDWPTLAGVAGIYALIVGGMIVAAAWA